MSWNAIFAAAVLTAYVLIAGFIIVRRFVKESDVVNETDAEKKLVSLTSTGKTASSRKLRQCLRTFEKIQRDERT